MFLLIIYVYDMVIMDILKIESWLKFDECLICGVKGNCEELVSFEKLIDIVNGEVYI